VNVNTKVITSYNRNNWRHLRHIQKTSGPNIGKGRHQGTTLNNRTGHLAHTRRKVLMKRSSCDRPRKAQKGSRGTCIALLILDLGVRRGSVFGITPRPLYPWERPGTHCTGDWVVPRCRSGCVRKISPPTGIRSSDRPASKSLYRLGYPAHVLI
jgi:hypothetical protein